MVGFALIPFLFTYIISFIVVIVIIVSFYKLFVSSRSKTSLENMLQSMKEVVIGIDSSYRIKFINHSAKRLFNIISEKIIGESLQTIIVNPNGYEAIINNLILPLKEKRNTDTVRIWIQNNSVPVIFSALSQKDEAGHLGNYLLIGTDVNILEAEKQKVEQKFSKTENNLAEIAQEKKRIEQLANEKIKELQVEHARLESAINNLSLGFIAIDSHKNITLVNKFATELFNLRYPSVIPIFDDITAQIPENANLKKNLELSFQSNANSVVKDILFQNRYLNFYISPIIVEQATEQERSSCIGLVILIEDETKSKIMERSREEFFTIASHELRTPLTAIRGFISLLQTYYEKEITDPQIRVIIDNIESSSNRLIGIVNDFLDTSKIEQGKLQIVIEKCSILRIIEESVRECMPIAQQKKLSINFEKPQGEIIVYADQVRLKQVLINLIGNAIKFTDTGGITIAVASRVNGMVVVKVSDTGRGISEENKYLLFKKFNQAGEDIYTRNSGGTGLGLYISKLLLAKMGGEIKLESSEPGKGTVFSFTIPGNP